ncbi:MAG: SCP2 sterol-binding domain-containing protein [Woeseiaceae bacterium]|nr:SCP2 sterol-binding domain-containing protein [Woeseiaceae bacterium]
MNPLETLLSPLAASLNRNIGESTPARELCAQLDGRVIAIRVRDTGLAMFFEINNEVLNLRTDTDAEPDVVLTGSLVTLARMAGPNGHDHSPAAVKGGLDITGDAFTAQAFQKLLGHARPDPEEELSRIVGDTAAHHAGQLARGVRDWAIEARATMGANLREYLQEESGQAPSRYEFERFGREVDALRDDVARLEARVNRLLSRV